MPTGEPANTIDRGGVSAGGTGGRPGPFTEAQARSRLQKQGYRHVSALTKDQDGVWRGSASRNGHQVHVGLDNRGNISTH
jgi:putative membrane protein